MKKIASNIAWLLSDKVFRLGLTLLVTIMVARYLGPAQFGELNFVIALVSIFAVVAGFGLQATVVNDLVMFPEKVEAIVVNALIIKLASAFICYLALILTIVILRPEGDLARIYVAIFGMTLFAKCADVYRYWFEAKIKSKHIVWSENCVLILVAALKLIMVYLQAPLLSFVWILVLEYFLVLLVAHWVFHHQVSFRVALSCFDLDTAKSLMSKSWPLLISAAAWVLYAKIDQVMLAELTGDEQVGIYSVAVRLSEVTNFVPGILVFSFMPAILPLFKTRNAQYLRRLQQIYDLLFISMFCLAIFITLLAPWLVIVLFGHEFAASSEILRIHIWGAIFTAFSLISARHLVNIQMQKVLMFRNILGLILNIVLNWIFIPEYGGVGAAWASLISLICVNYALDLFHPKLRHIFVLKTKSILQFNLLSNLKELVFYMRKINRS